MARRNRKMERSTQPAGIHQAIQATFPHYVTLAAQGLHPQNVYQEVAAHVAHCATCRAELGELLELCETAFSGQLPQVAIHRPADLSFLRSQQRPKIWHLNELGHLIISFSQPLLDLYEPMALAGAGRGQLLYRYEQEPLTVPNLNITVEVFSVEQQPEIGNVRVHVELTNRDAFDQGGSTVLLQAAEQRWSDTVNDLGDVVFERFPLRLLPQLRVEITPPADN